MIEEKSIITIYIEKDESDLLQRKLQDDHSTVGFYFFSLRIEIMFS